MKTDWTIRLAVARDVTAVRQCAEAAYQKYVAAIGRKPAPMVADFGAAIVAGHVHVAVNDDGLLCGFVVFYQDGDDVLLENVAVHPDVVGRGLGKQLITLCEKAARKSGARAVRLYTNAKMVQNLSMCLHLGYRQTGRRTEDGFDRVYFEKTL